MRALHRDPGGHRRAATLAAYSRKKFQYYSATLADDIDVAWEIYQQAIQDTLDATDERRQSA